MNKPRKNSIATINPLSSLFVVFTDSQCELNSVPPMSWILFRQYFSKNSYILLPLYLLYLSHILCNVLQCHEFSINKFKTLMKLFYLNILLWVLMLQRLEEDRTWVSVWIFNGYQFSDWSNLNQLSYPVRYLYFRREKVLFLYQKFFLFNLLQNTFQYTHFL